jgi:DeoR family transcriptional regulator of aga operon
MESPHDLVSKIRFDRNELSRAFKQIADFLIDDPEAFIRKPIRELSKEIGVSEPTLIRFGRSYNYTGFPDLRLAVAMSLASANTQMSARLEPRLMDKEVINPEAKRAIAQVAAALTKDDNTILFDSGSTVQFLAQELVNAPPLTIMSTGLNAVFLLRNSPQHKLILPGGVVRADAMSLSGRLVENALSGMSFDTLYVGVDSIHPIYGLSTFSEEEAHLNRVMIKAARRVVVLADASKFKSPALHKICDLSQVSIVISDDTLSPQTCDAVTAQGPKIVLAKLQNSDHQKQKA